jgi:hypothetical protein
MWVNVRLRADEEMGECLVSEHQAFALAEQTGGLASDKWK